MTDPTTTMSTSMSGSGSSSSTTTTDGTTTEEPGTTTDEPGTTTDEPGTTTEEPGTGSSTGSAGGLDFVMNFEGYGPHVGNDFEIRVQDGGGAEVGALAGNLAAADESFTIPGIVEDGVMYGVVWYMDLDGSGDCTPPDADHVWRMGGTADATGLTLTHPHDANWVDACGEFD